jgi:hypothetical protein
MDTVWVIEIKTKSGWQPLATETRTTRALARRRAAQLRREWEQPMRARKYVREE